MWLKIRLREVQEPIAVVVRATVSEDVVSSESALPSRWYENYDRFVR